MARALIGRAYEVTTEAIPGDGIFDEPVGEGTRTDAAVVSFEYDDGFADVLYVVDAFYADDGTPTFGPAPEIEAGRVYAFKDVHYDKARGRWYALSVIHVPDPVLEAIAFFPE